MVRLGMAGRSADGARPQLARFGGSGHRSDRGPVGELRGSLQAHDLARLGPDHRVLHNVLCIALRNRSLACSATPALDRVDDRLVCDDRELSSPSLAPSLTLDLFFAIADRIMGERA